MFGLKEYRDKAVGLPDLLNWAGFCDEGVVFGKDGSLMACAVFAGPDLASSTESGLEGLASQVNAALCRLEEGWSFHADVKRRPAKGYPQSTFPEPVSALIDQERRESYAVRDAKFENDFVLTLSYAPPPAVTSFLFSAIEDKGDDGKVDNLTTELARFNAGVDDILRLMGGGGYIQVARMDSESMLRFMYACLTGANAALKLPAIPMYLDATLGAEDFFGGNDPRIGNQHIRVVSIAGLPSASCPGMLDALSGIPVVYRWNTRFIPLDKKNAVKEIAKQRKNWVGARKGVLGHLKPAGGSAPTYENGAALSMADDANAAVTEAENGEVKFGYYTSTIIVMDEDKSRVVDAAKEIKKRIENEVGFVVAIETVNAIEAYLGSLPGHRYQNVRRPLLHTYNLADLLPLTSVYPGEAHNPCPFYPKQSPALLYAETTGNTPFRLNLHVGDLGHTTILGPTGAGKSTLLALLTAQLFRYPNAQVFFFDKGYSVFPLCKAMGGTHYDVLGEDSSLSFYPLRELDSPTDLAWAADWVETLFVLQGLDMNVTHRKTIFEALKLLASDSYDRTLQALQSKLGDTVLRDALAPYVQGGQMGTLLDSREDSLDKAKFQVFELEHLMSMGERADKWVVPVLLYLFRQIEKRLDGSPSYIVLDEAWLLLDHPMFQAKIKEWLKVLRKANCVVIFATQSISDVMRSKIRDVILESCPTKILLPNREARNEYSRAMYEQIGLNETEVGIIATSTPKQDYYVISPMGKRLISLGLKPLSIAFVGASGKDDLAYIRTLIAEHGDTPAAWVGTWLTHRDLPEWRRRYEKAIESA